MATRVPRPNASGTMQRVWDVQRPKGRGLACAGNSQKAKEAGQNVEGERGCRRLGCEVLRTTMRHLPFSGGIHWGVWAEEAGVEAQEGTVRW